MEIIEIQTLVDITHTNVRRPNQGTLQEFEQYKNWTTLNQCIGIRSIISYDDVPKVDTIDIKGRGFGTKYKGKHRVWTWRFYPDREKAFNTDTDPLGLLFEDIDQIPIIKKLTETINIDRAVFDCSTIELKNIIIKFSLGTE